MTLREIEKIIDKADIVYVKVKSGFSYHLTIREVSHKSCHKEFLEDGIKRGNILFYYNRNEDTGQMTLLAKVDHIDKEKKIVKKKLGDLNENELKAFCIGRSCRDCPFNLITDFGSNCMNNFVPYKAEIKHIMESEVEIETEVEE